MSPDLKKKVGGLVTYVNRKYIMNKDKYNHLNICNQHIEAQVLEVTKPNTRVT